MEPITLLEGMVATPSLSGQEHAVAQFIVNAMQQLAYTESYVDAAGNAVGMRENRHPDGTIDRCVVLLGHMDTVPGDIAVRIEDGVLHGRGSVDAKGPLATFIQAVAQATIPEGMQLVVIGAVEEESATSKGARFVVDRFRPKMCIIGEPSGWDGVTLGYKGRMLIDFVLERSMGHTAGQQSGVAEGAIAWWQQVDAYVTAFNQDKPRLFDQLLASIRDFHTASDGLTDSAEMRIGIRLPPDFDHAAFERQLCAWAEDGAITCHSYEAAYQSTRKTELARAFNVVLRQAGVRPRFKLKTGTSDMNVVGPVWQCPIVAYGPGDSSLDHTPQEHIILDDYQKAIDVLRQVLESL